METASFGWTRTPSSSLGAAGCQQRLLSPSHRVGHHSSISTCSYTRNVSISNNDFEWLGQSAVASWGRAVLNDGTNGEFPRFTVLSSNWAHDLGIIQKQSSFYFQAETAEASDFPIMKSIFLRVMLDRGLVFITLLPLF